MAFILAIISLGISLLMALLFRFRLAPIFHVILSIPLALAWGSGVLIVTFLNARTVPAAIYFAFWGGIYLALEIASINIIIMRRDKRKRQEEALNQFKDEGEGTILPVVEEQSQSPIEDDQKRISTNADVSRLPNTEPKMNGLDPNESIELTLRSSQKQDNRTKQNDLSDSVKDGSQKSNGEWNQSTMGTTPVPSRLRTSTVDTNAFHDCMEFESSCHFDSTPFPRNSTS